MGDSTPAILIEGAKKQYRGKIGGRPDAVVDVSISVSRGAIHGLLGPNGAGKTTTLKMLLGLVRPSGGTFQILGVPAGKAGAKSSLGYLPEQPYFPTNITVAEAMRLYGRLSGLNRAAIATQMPELLEKVGLEGREKAYLSKFSRGMLQRLGLAQAMLGAPSVLVLDEPASGLDPVGQRDVRNIMHDLRASGTAILLSSHQLSEVESVCDEVTILNQGLVAARGSLDSLLNERGVTTIRARGGEATVPASLAAAATKPATAGAAWEFDVPDADVRAAVDALDDAGWHLVSVEPTRDSLEDYFTKMLASGKEAADA